MDSLARSSSLSVSLSLSLTCMLNVRAASLKGHSIYAKGQVICQTDDG